MRFGGVWFPLQLIQSVYTKLRLEMFTSTSNRANDISTKQLSWFYFVRARVNLVIIHIYLSISILVCSYLSFRLKAFSIYLIEAVVGNCSDNYSVLFLVKNFLSIIHVIMQILQEIDPENNTITTLVDDRFLLFLVEFLIYLCHYSLFDPGPKMFLQKMGTIQSTKQSIYLCTCKIA